MVQHLEIAVAERRYEDAEQFLLWLVANSTVHRSRQDQVFLPTFSHDEICYLSTRIAGALCQLFADPAYGMTDETFFLFAKCHSSLSAILGVSGFDNADHVIQNLLDPPAQGKAQRITRESFNKILALHGLHSAVKLPYEQYLQSHPKHVLWQYLLAVAAQFCVLPQEHAGRNRILENLTARLDPAAFDEAMLGWLCIAWMHCSYASASNRNAIKATLNRILVNWMEGLGIAQDQQVEPNMRQGKPVLLIINEHFHSRHAMYRCLAPFIEALRPHFYLIGMTEKEKSDSVARKLFDSHYYLEWKGSNRDAINAVLTAVAKIRPHAIYYPSVGMHLPTILLSNLRLAPCQLMSLGHPASSHSPVMDYLVVEEKYINNSDLFSERLLCVDEGAFGFSAHADQPDRSELLEKSRLQLQKSGVLKIAIPAAAMKVNADYIDTLCEISRKAEVPVEFHFFPYMNKLSTALFRKQVARKLPNSIIHPPSDYSAYLDRIAGCQLHLSPYPFNSTNSIIDSLLLGIPPVVHRVADTDICAEAAIVDRLGIEGLTSKHSVADYVTFACDLINDAGRREMLSNRVREADIETFFYASHNEPAQRAADFVHKAIRNHHLLQQTSHRVITAQTLESSLTQEP